VDIGSPKGSNAKETEVMGIINKQGEIIRDSDRLAYLDVASKDGGADDMKSRINKTIHVFNTLRQIWNSKAHPTNKAVFLYGSET
jgi:hypothetical protein